MAPYGLHTRIIVVGLGRVERPTSRLSGVRSNHLSYKPDEVFKSATPARIGRANVRRKRKGNEGGGKTAICLSTMSGDILVRDRT